MTDKKPTSNPFADNNSPGNLTDSNKEDVPSEQDDAAPSKDGKKATSTYIFNSNYQGPYKDLNGKFLSMSGESDVVFDASAVDIPLDDRSQDFLDGRNRTVAACRDFGVRVVTLMNSKPFFFVNVALFSISFAFFLTCFMAFVPMSVEKQHLSGTLNDTTKLLNQCLLSFDLLQEKYNGTKDEFSQCLKEKDTAYKLLDATDKEKEQLNSTIVQLTHQLDLEQKAAMKRDKSQSSKLIANQEKLEATFERLRAVERDAQLKVDMLNLKLLEIQRELNNSVGHFTLELRNKDRQLNDTVADMSLLLRNKDRVINDTVAQFTHLLKLKELQSHSKDLAMEAKIVKLTDTIDELRKNENEQVKLIENKIYSEVVDEKNFSNLTRIIDELRNTANGEIKSTIGNLSYDINQVGVESGLFEEMLNLNDSAVTSSPEPPHAWSDQVELKNVVADLRSKLEAQSVELADLHRSIGEKVNSAAITWPWNMFSSSPAIQTSPFIILSSVIFAISLALY